MLSAFTTQEAHQLRPYICDYTSGQSQDKGGIIAHAAFAAKRRDLPHTIWGWMLGVVVAMAGWKGMAAATAGVVVGGIAGGVMLEATLPRCQALTGNNVQCKHPARPGQSWCAIHAQAHDERRCIGITGHGKGRRCLLPARPDKCTCHNHGEYEPENPPQIQEQ